jgi:hypothetical protein
VAKGALESGAAKANAASAPKCVSKLGEKRGRGRGRGRGGGGVGGGAVENVSVCVYI